MKTSVRNFIIRNILVFILILGFSMQHWIFDGAYWVSFFALLLIFHFVEYLFHRFVLHSEYKWLSVAAKAHGLHHHNFNQEHYHFSENSRIDKLLLSFSSIVIFLVVLAAPISLGLSLLTGDSILFYVSLSAFATYLCIYEFCHFQLHKALNGKSKPSDWAQHHIRHHAMPKTNYGVVTAWPDLIFRTKKN